MEILKDLNEEQRLAVQSDAQFIRVIAGAGSGKTRVLISRILYLMQKRNMAPYRICAITFTNKAANEMKERLGVIDGATSSVNTSTIHALCVRILREEHEAIGLTRYFTILDVADQESILREIYKAHDINRKEINFRRALSFISDLKFAGTQATPVSFLNESPFTLGQLETIFKHYVQRARQLNALDFDDLLIETNKLLNNNEAVRVRWQNRYEAILVDEFQDVDNVQYGIIQSLVGKDNQLYVVGDPDQTIYTWRGADVRNITHFDTLYPEAKTITLHQNYRSSQVILDAANQLIHYNKERTDKDLTSSKDVAYPIEYKEFYDADSESYWIGSTIKDLKDQGSSYDECAVLYRSSYLTRSLERVLVQRGIPYIVYGGLRFYERMEIKDTVAFLRMISHGDDLALRRSIGSAPRGIGNKTLEDYWDKAQYQHLTMYEVMHQEVVDKVAGARVRAYVKLIEKLKILSLDHSIADLIEVILDEGGLSAHYKKKDEEDRIETVKELKVDAMNFAQASGDNNLADYIQMVSLYGEKADVKDEEHVRLMTVHASKGLEFTNVFIMGVSEAIFPNKRALEERQMDALEEERRLMYVAITRAKDRLFVSNNTDYSFVLNTALRPSRFISEGQISQKEKSIINTNQAARTYVFGQGTVELEEEDEDEAIRFFSGDSIVHPVFGEGIVISTKGDVYEIAFAFPHGVKSIGKAFKGIELVRRRQHHG